MDKVFILGIFWDRIKNSGGDGFLKKYLILFLTFFKIGLTTFGGGYAMIAMMHEEVVERQKWITDDDLLEISAISESTPGPVAVNLSTFIGYRMGGILGSLLSTIAISLPSLIIIYLISLFFDSFIQNEIISHAFIGIKCAVCILIFDAGVKLFLKMPKKIINLIILSIVLVIMILLEILAINFSTIYLILVGGFIGLLFMRDKKEAI